MKKIVTVFLLLIVSALMNFAVAQTPSSEVKLDVPPAAPADVSKDYTMINGERVYTKADQMPIFPGGEQALFNFIHSNIKYPVEARANNVQGRVFVSFTIGRDGTVKNVHLLRGIGSGCDEAAL
ncbi:MAG TPA: TonB family protein [Bacteroidia bacterium]|nr:TonB family protein [Bacteroidia bacterium]